VSGFICRSCGCQFVQDPLCTTCGAQKLQDATVKWQGEEIERLRAEVLVLKNSIDGYENLTDSLRWQVNEEVRIGMEWRRKYEAVTKLPPIERDESMSRTYYPLPGGWEIQTKGTGSTFRIAWIDPKDPNKYDRMPVCETELHRMLEQMAKDIRAAIEGKTDGKVQGA
jgi:hypothetical protein